MLFVILVVECGLLNDEHQIKYWEAWNLMQPFEYSRCENSRQVIIKTEQSHISIDTDTLDHFRDATKTIDFLFDFSDLLHRSN